MSAALMTATGIRRASIAALRELGRRLTGTDDYGYAKEGGIAKIIPAKAQKIHAPPVEPREAVRMAEHQMHRDLIEWGAVQLRGDLFVLAAEAADRDEARGPKPEWTGMQKERAAALHARVIRLPELRLNLTLQVFYKDASCAGWWDLEPTKRSDIRVKHTGEVNYRLEKAGDPHRIHVDSFEAIRDRAIKILCNNERIMQAAQSPDIPG